jgi:hypothetical protein
MSEGPEILRLRPQDDKGPNAVIGCPMDKRED